jgi:[ribosomal protein S18]-alanine N-acetyltransferase
MIVPTGVVIREMRAGDLDRVTALEQAVFPSPWTDEMFIHELDKGDRALYLLAERGARLLGYIGAQLFGNEVHITNMAVDEELRRRGLGSALLINMARRGAAGGARWLTLEVRESNSEARLFYRLFGFDEVGIRRGYYVESGEDAVVMVTGDIRHPEFRNNLDRIEASLDFESGG